MTKIYRITNLINNKSYIGLTKRNPKKRLWEHSKPSRKKVSALTNAIIKYGKENFKFEIIYITNNSSLMEQYFIKLFNTISPNGYNLTYGGENPIFTKEECKRRSERRKKQKPPTKGMKQNSEWINKRIQSKRKPVVGISIQTGEIVEFISTVEAGKNIGNQSSISFAARNNKIAFGYLWSFKKLTT